MTINKFQKKNMADYISFLFEISDNYNVLSMNNEQIKIKEINNKELNKSILVYLINKKMPIYEYINKVNFAHKSGFYTANIFYKNEEDFFVRLAEKSYRKSLKHLNHNSKNKTLHLRELEKTVIELQDENQLAYYQPKTKNLETSLRIFEIKNVKLDYSHLSQNDHGYGFARDGLSKDFAEAIEVKKIICPDLIQYDNNKTLNFI